MACVIPRVREGSAAPSLGLVPMPSAMLCPSEKPPLMLSIDQRTKEQAAESWTELGESVPEAFGQEDQQKASRWEYVLTRPLDLLSFKSGVGARQHIPFWASPGILRALPWLSRQYESSLTPYREVRQSP